jgi:hypothetical protein
MASRYRRGSAVTPAPGGRVLHPHGHSVIMVLMAFASFTKPVTLTFLGYSVISHRTNRTYTALLNRNFLRVLLLFPANKNIQTHF